MTARLQEVQSWLWPPTLRTSHYLLHTSRTHKAPDNGAQRQVWSPKLKLASPEKNTHPSPIHNPPHPIPPYPHAIHHPPHPAPLSPIPLTATSHPHSCPDHITLHWLQGWDCRRTDSQIESSIPRTSSAYRSPIPLPFPHFPYSRGKIVNPLQLKPVYSFFYFHIASVNPHSAENIRAIKDNSI